MLAPMPPPFPFELSDQCVKCGLCLPHCPTYQLSASESEGPRGRIAIMESVAAARIPLTPGADQHLGNCLGCARCETVCPAKVSYLEIRDHHHAAHPRRLRQLLVWLLARGDSAGWQRTLQGLNRLGSWIPAVLLSRRLQAARALLATRTSASDVPASGQQTDTAAAPGRPELFRGCISSALDARAYAAARHLLAQLPQPVLPSAQGQCCGALAQHAGSLPLARQQRATIARATHPLVALESGCIADLRRSGRPVIEACRYLLQNWPPAWRPRLPAQTVALHLPCTHRNSCGDTAAVTALLARIEGVEVVEIRGLGCCGAGGLHVLERPEHAAAFAEGLLAEIPPGVTTLVSTNIGCRSHLRAQSAQLTVRHPLELLEDSLR